MLLPQARCNVSTLLHRGLCIKVMGLQQAEPFPTCCPSNMDPSISAACCRLAVLSHFITDQPLPADLLNGQAAEREAVPEHHKDCKYFPACGFLNAEGSQCRAT